MSLKNLFSLSNSVEELNKELETDGYELTAPSDEQDLEINPNIFRLYDGKRELNTDFYAWCANSSVKNYLNFLFQLKANNFTIHIGKKGTNFTAKKIYSNQLRACQDPQNNWAAYGAGFPLNPIIDLKFFITNAGDGAEYVCVQINFLHLMFGDYDLENNYFDVNNEAYQFRKALESGKLLLPQCFVFTEQLCYDTDGIINPWQWGACAPVEDLLLEFIEFVRSL
jgi:hypothetical protein